MTMAPAFDQPPSSVPTLAIANIARTERIFLPRITFVGDAYDAANNFLAPFVPEQNMSRLLTLRNALAASPSYPSSTVRFHAGPCIFEITSNNLFIIFPVNIGGAWTSPNPLRVRFGFEVNHISRPIDNLNYTLFFDYAATSGAPAWAKFAVPTDLRAHFLTFGLHNVVMEVGQFTRAGTAIPSGGMMPVTPPPVMPVDGKLPRLAALTMPGSSAGFGADSHYFVGAAIMDASAQQRVSLTPTGFSRGAFRRLNAQVPRPTEGSNSYVRVQDDFSWATAEDSGGAFTAGLDGVALYGDQKVYASPSSWQSEVGAAFLVWGQQTRTNASLALLVRPTDAIGGLYHVVDFSLLQLQRENPFAADPGDWELEVINYSLKSGVNQNWQERGNVGLTRPYYHNAMQTTSAPFNGQSGYWKFGDYDDGWIGNNVLVVFEATSTPINYQGNPRPPSQPLARTVFADAERRLRLFQDSDGNWDLPRIKQIYGSHPDYAAFTDLVTP